MLPSVEKDKIHCCRLVRVHGFPFKEANTASDRSGVSGVHQWSAMLPTSARVAQEVYEPLIGIQYPMLCGLKNGQWHIGTGSIRKQEQEPQVYVSCNGCTMTVARLPEQTHHQKPQVLSTGKLNTGSQSRMRNEITSSFLPQERTVHRAFEASASSHAGAQMRQLSR